ncbi:hypothetical protein K1T71_001451 [Dendrolimus kikuchii]|uniref:Uncharacterized protein n=1 Tax=Dendrolimus kikuchii TaxID=765133 RepID=A0ACC1DI47_9NEOP|nr:hypothetical protein K1T71_001451 [Dendrolimus kikuchii]
MADYENNPAVNNLRNYLRIRSVQPNVNYDECISFLKHQAEALGIPVRVYEVIPKKPILIMTWEGLEPDSKSLLLNSHMDVVPVAEKSWTHPPFAADLKDGVIYGRGIQDMKSVAIQYLEAVRNLKNQGVRPRRTIHLSFVPDEEIGGRTGMAEFVKTQAFKDLNVGFALDEGIACASDEYLVFNGERSIWHVNIVCRGQSGHGSLLLPDNCGEKLRYIIDKFMDLRGEAKKKLADNPKLTIGDVTTVNLTKISGGLQNNVVPDKMIASFDLRLDLGIDHQHFDTMIGDWCREAGPNVIYDFDQKDPYVQPTAVDDANAYWAAFKSATDSLNLKLKVCTFPGGTDSRFIRECGIPALGFSPMANTRPALHENDESLPVATFLNGIPIYEKIILSLANVA